MHRQAREKSPIATAYAGGFAAEALAKWMRGKGTPGYYVYDVGIPNKIINVCNSILRKNARLHAKYIRGQKKSPLQLFFFPNIHTVLSSIILVDIFHRQIY